MATNPSPTPASASSAVPQPPRPGERTPVRVLILGSGGREHALGWKLKQSKRCGKVYFAPGNGGTAAIGENVNLPFEPVNTKHVDAITYFCKQHEIGLIVVGPEDPLCGGIVDRLRKDNPGRAVFGPVAAAAKLEGDKAWAKQLMRACSVPTADARSFSALEPAMRYVQAHEEPLVVKAAGLCKGKGVFVTRSQDEALEALRIIFKDRAFGEAGAEVVIEEKLSGQEISVLALVDGSNLFVLDPTQDHKQVGEGDVGPNTGGMGAYCPTPLMSEPLMAEVQREVLVPIVDALRRDDVAFTGVLYAGLMLTPGGPRVLEFNTRFGDPECQPLMCRLKGDLIDILLACCDPRQPALDRVDLSWDPRTACCVVVCSGGYPGDYAKGKPITGIEEAQADPDVSVFHAGTKLDKDGTLVTAGGRVLNVVALGRDLKEAQAKANAAAAKVRFEGAFHRADIGWRVMK